MPTEHLVKYEAVIGLEVHVQLNTGTKLFCADSTEFGAPPNSRVCPVCLGLPGALPVVSRAAVESAVKAALGLQCTVHRISNFARKNYFYPDLPKGYQITQYDEPLATAGHLHVQTDQGEQPFPVRIRRVHLEEDAGKLLHDRLPGRTAVDLNRAGSPLIEIVTEPDLSSPSQARAFLNHLVRTLAYLDVSDCSMEKGSLRVDANISVRTVGSRKLGTKTELKNLNSFAAVEKALAFEIRRQRDRLATGKTVLHETLLWDVGRAEARPMRSKEETHDYRYFPEPDLPPLVLEHEIVDEIRRSLPEPPAMRAERFRQDFGLPAYDADVLTASKGLADYFEAVASSAGDAKAASNWVMTEVLGWLNQRQRQIGSFPLPAERLGELIQLIAAGTISNTAARHVFSRAIETGTPPDAVIAAENLAQVSDEASLEAWVDRVLADHAAEAARFRQGENKVFGFLMGELMKLSGGQADPRLASRLLREKLQD